MTLSSRPSWPHSPTGEGHSDRFLCWQSADLGWWPYYPPRHHSFHPAGFDSFPPPDTTQTHFMPKTEVHVVSILKKKNLSAGVAGFTSSLASWVCSCTSQVSQSIEAGIKHDLPKTLMWNNTFYIFKRRNKMLRLLRWQYTSRLHLLATLVSFTALFLFLYFRLISIYLPHKYLFYKKLFLPAHPNIQIY